MNRTIRIATRQSQLALWQAEYVRDLLRAHHPGLQVELLPMSTRGDRILDAPLAKVGGKGLFVKELEHALLNGDADLAVHSMKDVPMEFPEGLGLAAICRREDPRDALVSVHYADLDALPHGARVGTSSLRRQCQLRSLRPDLNILDLRGNVNTRLQKLDMGEYDAIILAAAGLIRLGFSERIRAFLPVDCMLPAVGQGAVGIECRLNDEFMMDLLMPLHDEETGLRVQAERSMNLRLHGGCQVPIAGHAIRQGDELFMSGLVGALDGRELLRAELRGPVNQAEVLGTKVAEMLLAQGAGRLLQALYD